jgi:hypothetical protein
MFKHNYNMPFEKGNKLGKGRPPKADEEKIRRLGINAIESVYGSVEAYYIHIAKESKQSFPHLKLLQEYVYGKPKETVELLQDQPEFDMSNLTNEELDVLSKINGRKSNNAIEGTD